MNTALKHLGRTREEDALAEDIRTVERLHRIQPSLDCLAERTHPAITAELLDRAELERTDYILDGEDHAEILGTLHDAYESSREDGGVSDTLFQYGSETYTEQGRRVFDERDLATGLFSGHAAGIGAVFGGAQAGHTDVGMAAMVGALTATYAGAIGYHHYTQGYRAARTVDKAEAFIAAEVSERGDYRFAVNDPYDLGDSPLSDPEYIEQNREENTAAFLETLDDWTEEDYLSADELPDDYKERLAEFED